MGLIRLIFNRVIAPLKPPASAVKLSPVGAGHVRD